jgi:murein L,D-transpeptidase YcbB/YkuD
VRRSRVDLDDTFVQVLIPDFHLEFWQAGKRAARHRVIVGKPRGTKCDEKTATMTHGVRHARAVGRDQASGRGALLERHTDDQEQELDPQQAANPLYYQTNGYEVMRAGEPREWVRELPRPGNSLGFVKFLFPNPHDTYIHDTPTQPLFSRPVRAFSHGCMRVHEARDFARTVLSHTGQWNEGRFNALYDDWRSMAPC